MLSRMSSASTLHAWSVDDELGLTLDEGSCSTSTLLDHVDHPLNGARLESVIEADELEGIFSAGGVTLRGGGAKYDRFRISQNETNSGP